MNQTIAVPLALLCILVTWAYVWSHIVVRRTQKGEHAVIAHIFAAIYGTGAAFGTFLLVGATLISPRHELDVTMGIAGATIILAYALVLAKPGKSQSTQTHLHALSVTPALMLPAAADLPDQDASQHASVQLSSSRALMVVSQKDATHQRTGINDSDLSTPPEEPGATHQTDGHQDQKSRNRTRQANRLTEEQALGMPLRAFIDERHAIHTMLWVFMSILGFAGYFPLQFSLSQETDSTTLIIAVVVTVIITIIFMTILTLSFSLLSILLVLMMPLASLSVRVEAWLRIRLNLPYVPSHEPYMDIPRQHTYTQNDDYVDLQDDDSEDLDDEIERTARRRRYRYTPSSRSDRWENHPDRSADILLALALGAWIGSAWGDDDTE